MTPPNDRITALAEEAARKWLNNDPYPNHELVSIIARALTKLQAEHEAELANVMNLEGVTSAAIERAEKAEAALHQAEAAREDLSPAVGGMVPQWTPAEAQRLRDFHESFARDDYGEAYNAIYWLVSNRAADPYHPWAEIDAVTTYVEPVAAAEHARIVWEAMAAQLLKELE